MLQAVYECPKPVIARIQGDVYAGGMGLVAACDIAVSVDTAGYCLSEVKLGLIPATISPYVIRAMGIETGIDLDKLIDAGKFISDFLGRKPNSRAATALLNKRAN